MTAIYQAKYARTEKGKAAAYRAKRAYIERHRDKKRAWNAVQQALKFGRITAEPCLDCGSTPAQAHHFLGYELIHVLDVVWLCDRHHKAAHVTAGAD